MIARPIEDLVEQANLAIADAANVRSVLGLPVVAKWFVGKSVDYYQGFLKAADDDQRRVWQVRAQLLNELYASLVQAVSAGDIAAERLAELAAQEEKKK